MSGPAVNLAQLHCFLDNWKNCSHLICLWSVSWRLFELCNFVQIWRQPINWENCSCAQIILHFTWIIEWNDHTQRVHTWKFIIFNKHPQYLIELFDHLQKQLCIFGHNWIPTPNQRLQTLITRLRFEVFSLERLWTLDKVFVLPPLEIRFSVAVEWRRVILIKSYPPTMSRTVKKVCGGGW